MVKVVTQETFDEYVRENMEEFDMSKEEAIQEAKDQLLTQVRNEKYVINTLGLIKRKFNVCTSVSYINVLTRENFV